MKILPFFLQVLAGFAVISSAAAESDTGFFMQFLSDTGGERSLPLLYFNSEPPHDDWYGDWLDEADGLSICWYCITRSGWGDPSGYCEDSNHPYPTIKKVKMTLYDSNGQVLTTRTESAAPYCLGGDSGGTIFPVPALWSDIEFKVKVEAYSDDSDDVVDFTLEVPFKLGYPSKVDSYVLWDATTNSEIQEIPSTLDLDSIVLDRDADTQFNIEAVVEGRKPDAVRITLLDDWENIIEQRTESSPPYMLGGDSGGDIFGIPGLFRGRVAYYVLETSFLLGGVWQDQEPQYIYFPEYTQGCSFYGPHHLWPHQKKCGGFAKTNRGGPSCWCDELCQSFDDCCYNYEEFCLTLCKDDYLAMSDTDLFFHGLEGGHGHGPKIGDCYIQDATNSPGEECEYFAKGNKDLDGIDAYGIPEGTGCIVGMGSYWPGPGLGSCPYISNNYVVLTPEETVGMCSVDLIQNGGYMMRYGIENDYCDLPC